MTEYAVRAVDVSKRFLIHTEKRTSLKERFVRGRPPKAREFWALKNANFDIPKGETFGIIGHNGSGKSTALKVLTGVYRPTSGSVEVNGRVSALLELGAGFHPELTGRENIRLNGSILGFSPRMIDSMMDDIIDFSGVEEFIDTPVKVYSSGMYVRLGFAIAVKVDPEVLLVDEVIAVGDEQFQRKCFDYLYELRRKGATIVLVSHGMSQIEEMCDQVVWLNRGKVQEIGPARDVVASYMQQVNAAEDLVHPERPASGGTAYGSGQARVTQLRTVTANGTEVSTLVAGEAAEILVDYVADESVRDVSFRLEIMTEDRVCVAAPDTLSNGAVDLQSGRGTLRLTIPRLPLNPGAYLLTTHLSSRGHVLERNECAHELKVRKGGTTTGGLVEIESSWKWS